MTHKIPRSYLKTCAAKTQTKTMKQAKNERQEQAIELVKSLFKKHRVKIKSRKMFIKGKLYWQDAVYIVEGTKKINNKNFLIETFIKENLIDNTSKTIIVVYKEGMKESYIAKEVLVCRFKTTEDYLNQVKNELEQTFNALN